VAARNPQKSCLAGGDGAIPAPPFGEKVRAEWLALRFAEAGLSHVETDEVGNVHALLPASNLPAESTGRSWSSRHLDTVFPADTPLNPVLEWRFASPLRALATMAPVVIGMLAIAHALFQAKVELPAPLILLGNVGEEGEGDLRGVRHFL